MQTKIILEIGCNHQGDIETAEKMIIEAARLGVWGVKFQKRDIDSIPIKIREAPRDPVNNFGNTYEAHRRALEFSLKQIQHLKEFTENLDLQFVCSAFDPVSVKGLILAGVKWIKFPSQLFLNEKMHDTYKESKTTNNKLIVSTGMHTKDEIDSGLVMNSCNINVILHCISVYPTKIEMCNLSTVDILIKDLEWYDIGVGYSSHEIEAGAVPYAVAIGAEWIERHFTLCKGWKGHDHRTVSSTPGEIEKMIIEIKRAEKIRGLESRPIGPEEMIVAKKFRDNYGN